MYSIIIMNISKQDDCTFEVEIENNAFLVMVDDDYTEWLNLTCSKEELIKASFKFLLEREPLSSILQKFNIKIIQNYFPEYRQEVGKYL